MTKRPSARWTGTFDFAEIGVKLAVSLFSSERKSARKSLLVQVHEDCKTRVPPPDKSKTEDEEDSGEKETGTSAAVQTTRQIRCPSCNRALRPEEIALAVDIPNVGLILLSKKEVASLKPETVKEVKVNLRRDPSEALAVIGTGRRLYVMPKGQSMEDYYRIMTTMHTTKIVGFMPELAVGKKSYTFVIRPITTPVAVFGSATRVLVADEFFDTEKLIDPRELQLLPAEPPSVTDDELERIRAKAHLFNEPIDLNECINRERLHLEQLIREKAAPTRVARPL